MNVKRDEEPTLNQVNNPEVDNDDDVFIVDPTDAMTSYAKPIEVITSTHGLLSDHDYFNLDNIIGIPVPTDFDLMTDFGDLPDLFMEVGPGL